MILAEGYDAADAVADGWTSEHIDELEKEADFHAASSSANEVDENDYDMSAVSHFAFGGAHIDVARAIVSKYGEENILYCHNRFYRWTGSFWQELPELIIQRLVTRVFELIGQPKDAKAQNLASVIKVLKSECFNPNIVFDSPTDTISCINGELKYSGESWELTPHVREHYQLSLIPVKYDAGAKAPRFELFLDEIFANDPDSEEKEKLVLEFLGYSLTNNCSFEKFLLLIGEGANGKSVLLNIMENLVGPGNVSGVDPAKFDGFQRAHLRGKLVNIVTELRHGLEINDAALKSLVSGELTTAEEKFQPPFNFRPYAKHWFATNHLPNTRDVSRAFFRRAIVLEFNMRFEGAKCDVTLSSKLKNEQSGILNFALQGLAALYRNGQFTEPASSLVAKLDWQKDVDQIAQFVDECCKTGPFERVPVSTLYSHYRDWAIKSGISKLFTKNKFGRRLRAMGIKGVDGACRIRLYEGIDIDYGKSGA